MFCRTIAFTSKILPYCLLISCDKLPSVNLSEGLQDATRQIVVVKSQTANNQQALLSKYEKIEGKWVGVGTQADVSLGRTGLAPVTGDAQAGQPAKREGDGKSPAGIFTFGNIFGYAPASEVNFKMPYIQADESLECVDDSKSGYYNQLVDNKKVEKDWTSSEFMRRTDHQYRWGIVVNYNTSPTQPMGGSCIFLHIWKGPGSPTSGCTAMSEENLLELLHWLDPAKSPRLLQVTEKDYPAYQQKFGLP